MKMFNIKTSSNLYMLWNFGSIIFMMIIIQFIFGLLLSMNYINNMNFFISSFNLYYNLNNGWFIRLIHSNLTSMIFLIIIFHLIRNMIFKTFINFNMWISGLLLMLMIMLISFLGYSLIWNQMSYWAMMVITNFFSSIPFFGEILVIWMWGNFNINFILLNRFFSLHFFMPMLLILMSFIHLMILHMNKSSNPLGIDNKFDMLNLNPLFLFKDLYLLFLLIYILIMIILIKPNYFNNIDSFNMMNYFKTPIHIEPEWYFLFFYSIIRLIENKLSGLLLVILFIILFFFLPLFFHSNFQSSKFNFYLKLIFMILINLIYLIGYIGMKFIEYPFNYMNMILIFFFFFFFFFFWLIKSLYLK